jgi:C4-type Zn-finger protein
MQCPVCKKEMRLAGTHETNNPATGDLYERTVYACDADDAWITVELPKPQDPKRIVSYKVVD